MNTKLKTPPAKTPVTLAEMKSYLRVDETAEDLLITTLIGTATEMVEKYIDKKLINQTWLVSLNAPPQKANPNSTYLEEGFFEGAVSELFTQSSCIELPFGPLSSVEKLTVNKADGTSYTMPGTDFQADTMSNYGKIALGPNTEWPSDALQAFNGLVFEVVVGYGPDENDVPQAIRNAIKVIVGKLFEDRGDDVDGEMGGKGSTPIPLTALSMLRSFHNYKVK